MNINRLEIYKHLNILVEKEYGYIGLDNIYRGHVGKNIALIDYVDSEMITDISDADLQDITVITENVSLAQKLFLEANNLVEYTFKNTQVAVKNTTSIAMSGQYFNIIKLSPLSVESVIKLEKNLKQGLALEDLDSKNFSNMAQLKNIEFYYLQNDQKEYVARIIISSKYNFVECFGALDRFDEQILLRFVKEIVGQLNEATVFIDKRYESIFLQAEFKFSQEYIEYYGHVNINQLKEIIKQ